MKIDTNTCWYDKECALAMNNFYNVHLKNKTKKKQWEDFLHTKTFSDILLNIPYKNVELLDLGCGTGALSIFCNEFKYCGADMSYILNNSSKINFPQYDYYECDILIDDLEWLNKYQILVLNAVIDVMQYPLYTLEKILHHVKEYIIIHRQEITISGQTKTIQNNSYNSITYHSIINRHEFEKVLQKLNFEIITEKTLEFTNWENGGNSFLLKRI